MRRRKEGLPVKDIKEVMIGEMPTRKRREKGEKPIIFFVKESPNLHFNPRL